MKLREAKELPKKSVEELKELEKTTAEALFKARLQHGVGQLEQTTSLRELRRDIGRIKNLLRQTATKA